MAINLQEVKSHVEGNVSVCRATWLKVLDTALLQQTIETELVQALRESEIAVQDLCENKHPDNQCWITLANVRAAIASARAAINLAAAGVA